MGEFIFWFFSYNFYYILTDIVIVHISQPEISKMRDKKRRWRGWKGKGMQNTVEFDLKSSSAWFIDQNCTTRNAISTLSYSSVWNLQVATLISLFAFKFIIFFAFCTIKSLLNCTIHTSWFPEHFCSILIIFFSMFLPVILLLFDKLFVYIKYLSTTSFMEIN